jgi:hypothetical protein
MEGRADISTLCDECGDFHGKETVFTVYYLAIYMNILRFKNLQAIWVSFIFIVGLITEWDFIAETASCDLNGGISAANYEMLGLVSEKNIINGTVSATNY